MWWRVAKIPIDPSLMVSSNRTEGLGCVGMCRHGLGSCVIVDCRRQTHGTCVRSCGTSVRVVEWPLVRARVGSEPPRLVSFFSSAARMDQVDGGKVEDQAQILVGHRLEGLGTSDSLTRWTRVGLLGFGCYPAALTWLLLPVGYQPGRAAASSAASTCATSKAGFLDDLPRSV